MPDIQVNGLEPMSQMQLGIVVQAAALKPCVSVCDGPTNQIAKNVVIKMQFKRNAVVEAKIFGKYGVAMYQAYPESDHFSVTPPHEKPRLVRHRGSKATKILLGQLFKVQL